MSTNRATEFSKDLHKALSLHKDFMKRFGVEAWKKNWPLPGSRETVDVVGLRNGRPVVLLEAGLLRENPASNVVKIWK